MLQQLQSEQATAVYLEPVEDLTEAFLVYLDDIYVGRVFRSICFPRWLTSGTDDGRYASPALAAQILVTNWQKDEANQAKQFEGCPF